MPEIQAPTFAEVEHDLLATQIAYQTFSNQKEDKGIDEFDICTRTREFNIIGYNFLADGLVATWATEGFLENRSHRLIIPSSGADYRYHRDPFSIDYQYTGTSRINVIGAEAIAASVIKGTHEAALGAHAARLQIWEMARIGWVGITTRMDRTTRC